MLMIHVPENDVGDMLSEGGILVAIITGNVDCNDVWKRWVESV